MNKLFLSGTAVSLLLTACSNQTSQQPSQSSVSQPSSSQQPTALQEQSVSQKTTLPSGLAYEIIKAAPDNAISPAAGKNVVVHYTGWLDNNGQPDKQFDSSVTRGEPFVFTIGVGQVIKGWDEGVLSMKVGEKRRLYIPAALGYGARGAGAVIPGNAALIFDVELLGVA